MVGLPACLLLLADVCGGEHAAEAHGFDRGGGDDDHGALFADRLIEHVHAAEMEGALVVVVDARGLGELLGDLNLGFPQDDACLTLTLCLGLLRHGVFECLRDAHVAHFHGLDGDAPGCCLLVEDLLELATEGLALGDHLSKLVTADGLAQGGLRAEGDGLEEVFDLEDGLLGVPHQPEDDGIDVDGNGVTGERGLCADGGNAHTLIDVSD